MRRTDALKAAMHKKRQAKRKELTNHAIALKNSQPTTKMERKEHTGRSINGGFKALMAMTRMHAMKVHAAHNAAAIDDHKDAEDAQAGQRFSPNPVSPIQSRPASPGLSSTLLALQKPRSFLTAPAPLSPAGQLQKLAPMGPSKLAPGAELKPPGIGDGVYKKVERHLKDMGILEESLNRKRGQLIQATNVMNATISGPVDNSAAAAQSWFCRPSDSGGARSPVQGWLIAITCALQHAAFATAIRTKSQRFNMFACAAFWKLRIRAWRRYCLACAAQWFFRTFIASRSMLFRYTCHKFKERIARTQGWARGFIRCTAARRLALMRLWDQYTPAACLGFVKSYLEVCAYARARLRSCVVRFGLAACCSRRPSHIRPRAFSPPPPPRPNPRTIKPREKTETPRRQREPPVPSSAPCGSSGRKACHCRTTG
jgi:hypothetical protein